MEAGQKQRDLGPVPRGKAVLFNVWHCPRRSDQGEGPVPECQGLWGGGAAGCQHSPDPLPPHCRGSQKGPVLIPCAQLSEPQPLEAAGSQKGRGMGVPSCGPGFGSWDPPELCPLPAGTGSCAQLVGALTGGWATVPRQQGQQLCEYMAAGTSWAPAGEDSTTVTPAGLAESGEAPGQVAGPGGGDSQAGLHSLPQLCGALAAGGPDCTVLLCS